MDFFFEKVLTPAIAILIVLLFGILLWTPFAESKAHDADTECAKQCAPHAFEVRSDACYCDKRLTMPRGIPTSEAAK